MLRAAAITMALLVVASSCSGGLVRKVTTARPGFPRQLDVGRCRRMSALQFFR